VLKARPVIVGILIIFAIYAVLVSPEQSAGVVKAAFTQLAAGLSAVGTFFNALIAG
jgi:hypothetical protein